VVRLISGPSFLLRNPALAEALSFDASLQPDVDAG
jgi:hypothetical protein